MGNLTRDIERLCGEIEASRVSRASMKAGIAKENEANKSAVSKMRTGFAKEHKAMAKADRSQRKDFMNSLSKEVKAARRDTAKDLAGARKAWARMAGAQKGEKKTA